PAIALVPVGLICFDWSNDRAKRLKLWLGGVAIAVILVVAADLVLRSSSLYSVYADQQSRGFYTVRSLHTVLTHPFATWNTTWSVFSVAFTGYVTVPLIVLA